MLTAARDIYSVDMANANQQSDPIDRVMALRSIYSDPCANAAHLLCDQHDPAAIAFTLVGPDLDCVNITYVELCAESTRFAAALSSLGVAAGGHHRYSSRRGPAVRLSLYGCLNGGAMFRFGKRSRESS